ncbi:anthrone oxygenase family protein [Streptomyces chattanoogensis]|uniref:anthrone oxygenase family protein n=1 Tax=Streptomyces chattanoogensis TaxID=66876 RepID=UPI0005D9649B|nr:hypothetical protein T261_3226 [Streptomyces lydicus]
MYDTIRTAALIAATVTTGLSAGLFYAFACAVMPGLRQSDDRTFVTAMRRINVAILNGWFALGFFGALVFTAVAAGMHLRADGHAVLPWVVAALALYLVLIGTTFAVNVPLNDRLEAAGETDAHPGPAAVRERFEARWVRWNVVRAVSGTAALGCLVWALVLHGRIGGGAA